MSCLRFHRQDVSKLTDSTEVCQPTVREVPGCGILPLYLNILICKMGLLPALPNTQRRGFICLGNPMDRGAWWAAVHEVSKSRTRLSDFTFTFMHWKEMATHSSVLAWKIPGVGEPGGLLSQTRDQTHVSCLGNWILDQLSPQRSPYQRHF